ncbi:MAG TPA: endopeptidase La [Planctomycetota bacterium]|nr:endopeptidase La [Planctomycetota bacterium]
MTESTPPVAPPQPPPSPTDLSSPGELHLPGELPVLPLRDVVAFPFLVMPLVIGREKTLKLVDETLVKDRLVALVTQRSALVEEPGPADLYEVGTAASIIRMLRFPDNTMRILVQGLTRIRVTQVTQTSPYMKARVEELVEKRETSVELEALTRNVSGQFRKMISLVPNLPEEMQVLAMNVEQPAQLADLVTSALNLGVAEKQAVLEDPDLMSRLGRVSAHLRKELELLELSSKIESSAQTELTRAQREFYLRKQLEAIQKELGMEDPAAQEVAELRRKIKKTGMSAEARKEAELECDRLERMHPSSAERSVVRTYLDLIIAMPWKKTTRDQLDLKRVQKVLDEDHYNLDRVKERIVEYLGVRKLKPEAKGPILCFVGPPGVGKTSIGKSIARAMGRNFVRLSLGGVRDEAEIRGHRRTYVGAMPGRIIQGIRRAGSKNPVFMLDEVDKLGVDFRGDPAAALLEVLDPEQNFAFSDHYLDVPFDLSKVMFITTANLLDPVPPALRDRMEVLTLPGYTLEEKVKIARQFLIPKQLDEHGLRPSKLVLKDDALAAVIRDYTREAGVRDLERGIARICRKTARAVAEGRRRKTVVTAKDLHGLLGPVKFFSEVADRTGVAGVATGLAWTQQGGEVLFVEATRMRGRRELILTGQLGDVLKESAQAALSYVRTHAVELDIAADFFEKNDIHVHVPAGATPKDGPSAGVTIVAAMVSLLTGKPVPGDVAMTGEITLSGKVLPVGGIKEKVLAAKRAEIRTVILPRRNEKDLEEVPKESRKGLRFVFAERIDDALKAVFGRGALPPKKQRRPKPTKSRRKSGVGESRGRLGRRRSR